MKICDFHEIVFTDRECPCCNLDRIVEGLQNEINDLKEEAKALEEALR